MALAAQLVRMTPDRGMTSEVISPDADLIAEMAARGFKHSGYNFNPHHRAELRGQPTFDGLCGPMGNRDGIRYECWASNEVLSS